MLLRVKEIREREKNNLTSMKADTTSMSHLYLNDRIESAIIGW